jgi:hypothetical protein
MAGTFVVEQYWPGITTADFAQAVDRVRASAEAIADAGRFVHCLHSTLVPEDEAAFCVIAAESKDLVEEVYSRAGVPYERILAAVESAVGQATTERSET